MARPIKRLRAEPDVVMELGRRSRVARSGCAQFSRHGTIALFAALIQSTGKPVARTVASRTHVEWRRFLRPIDRQRPREAARHPIADNYARAQASRGVGPAGQHPRFTMHVTPTVRVLSIRSGAASPI